LISNPIHKLILKTRVNVPGHLHSPTLFPRESGAKESAQF
jgi:hypothetical protein